MQTLQSVHPKQNQKQITHESNKLCMVQTGRKKQLEVLRRIKQFYQRYRR